MGFVINQGKDLHDNLIPIIQPVFFVSCKGLESNFSYRKPETFSGSTDINVERNTILTPLSGRIKGARDRSINSGKDARHMRICGYFSYIMEIFARQIFNYRNPSLWPYYEIDMNKYAIYLDEHLPILQEETLQLALNVTLVAFCTYVSDPEGFDKSGFTELNFDNLSFPKRLSYNYKGFNQRFSYSKTNIVVVGYGIITNVDIKNYKFHVATPLTQKQLQEEVKIIARGVNFTMPPEFIKFQGDYNDDNYKVLATSDQNWFIWNSDFKRRVTDTKKKHV
uniref:BPL/LPL catalytic domain-containing protein n=1 Tax=Rhabditophanes sp. KR3021 TaxID=114890 RepID=A0AC35TNP0_9BILA